MEPLFVASQESQLNKSIVVHYGLSLTTTDVLKSMLEPTCTCTENAAPNIKDREAQCYIDFLDECQGILNGQN